MGDAWQNFFSVDGADRSYKRALGIMILGRHIFNVIVRSVKLPDHRFKYLAFDVSALLDFILHATALTIHNLACVFASVRALVYLLV